MAIYSHSRLSTFEQCKYRYKLRYIDKIPSPVEKSIEAHLGICTHDALEWLYGEVMKKRLPELEEVLEKYLSRWQEDYKENFIIVKKDLTVEDYKNKGIKFILDYYFKHKPFEDGTLEMEKKIWVELHPNSSHKLIGFIDRLVYNKEKDEYEIHDYKTAKNLPSQTKLDQDRQLALYGIGIKQLYGENKSILLTWHYLSHNKQIFSKRTNEELEQLKKDVLNLIQDIEVNIEFPCQKSILCGWCEYKTICKGFGNRLPEQYRQKQSSLAEHTESKGKMGEINKGDLEKINKEFPTVGKYIKG
jgi:putative RecB family exonuclease